MTERESVCVYSCLCLCVLVDGFVWADVGTSDDNDDLWVIFHFLFVYVTDDTHSAHSPTPCTLVHDSSCVKSK